MFTRVLLSLLLLVVWPLSIARPSTQTIHPVPAFVTPTSDSPSDAERFLREEDAEREGEAFASFVVSGGTHGTSPTLTATISAAVGRAGGFRVSAPATARTYTASRRTFVFIYSHDNAVAGDFTITGGSGCTIPAGTGLVNITNGGSFVFIECATGSALPTVTVASGRGITVLMAVDTSATAITLTSPLKNPYAVRPSTILGYVSVREHGAVGDNVQDDTLAIQTALNAACNRVAALFFPAGSYRLTTAVVTSNSCPLTLAFGAGYDQTFVYINSTTSNAFTFIQQAPIIIRDMRIEVTSQPPTAGACIRISGPNASTLNQHSIVENVYLNGCFDGVDWTGSSNIIVRDSFIQSFLSQGIRAQSTPAFADSGDNQITGNNINPSVTTDGINNIYVTSGGGLRITNNKLQNANIGVWVDWAGTVNSSIFILANNSIDGPASSAIRFSRQPGITTTLGAITITGNTANVSTNAGSVIQTDTEDSGTWLQQVSITSNDIAGGSGPGAGILLRSGQTVHIETNTIRGQAGTFIGISADTNVTGLTIGPNSYQTVTTPLLITSTPAYLHPRPLFAELSLDFGATAANTCDALTLAVAGARDGDAVELALTNALASVAQTIFTAWVSANDVVTVRRCNVATGAAADPAAATVGAWVYDRNYLP